MIWQEVKIYTADDRAELLAARLLNLGVSGWQQESAAEVRRYLAEGTAFDYADKALAEQAAGEGTVFTLYIEDGADGDKLIDNLQAELADYVIEIRRRDSEEWEDNWKQYYKPFKIGRSLMVCPSWEDYRPQPGEQLLRIEPGGSFGTGQHYTTRLCLQLLEKYLPPEAAVLDLGCGTGILSIGALHLGAKSAVAVDIEENSAAAAQNNAALNGYRQPEYRALAGDILADEALASQIAACAEGAGYDIIAVNIVADVIIAMSGLFGGLLAGGGLVVCSGIIDERRAEVLAAMRRVGFSPVEEQAQNGWCALAFRRG